MWISQLNLDLVACTLTCVVTANPDAPALAFRVEFQHVGKVSVDRYHDPDGDTFGDFERFHMRPIEGTGRAVFETNSGDAVLTFEASADPFIVPITVHPAPSEVFERGGPASV
ncbi:MAG: hypothetical protein JWN40_2837 [Phycisphaerales bacterium]|nr:hypothetical protein [Phycisphaerales bacterium]